MRHEGNGFVTGMIAGVALGALMVAAMTPQVRHPVMRGMGAMGNRMGRMMRRGTDMVEQMMPGDAD